MSPTSRSNSTAAGTMGKRPTATSKPTPRSSSQRTAPVAASSPHALPPASMMACTLSTRLEGWSKSVSRVPGAAPRTSTPATAPSRVMMTVQPVGRRVSVKWPTSMPATRVMLPASPASVLEELMAVDYGAHAPSDSCAASGPWRCAWSRFRALSRSAGRGRRR